MRTLRTGRTGDWTLDDEIAARCGHVARPLRNPHDLDPLIDAIEDARYVLLGEASHGTSEYYVWRMWLTQRLIREKGFSFIAVEGDWPDCYRVNRYVKGYPDAGATARRVLTEFERWPTWMWANWEIVALAEWLRAENAGRDEARRVGFYGLDVYSLWESMDAVMHYLQRVDGRALEAAHRAFRCFEPYGADGQEYARNTISFIPQTCEDEAVAMLAALRREQPDPQQDGREAFFVAEQNALVVKNAETYYRAMVRGGPASWNVRDRHMVETLERLVRFHGTQAKAVVWEHNTHIGDARATDMAADGMVNVGQLVREAHVPGDVFLVGFGSYRGSVIAGRQWGAPMERMPVPQARAGSWEELLHRSGPEDRLLIMDELVRGNDNGGARTGCAPARSNRPDELEEHIGRGLHRAAGEPGTEPPAEQGHRNAHGRTGGEGAGPRSPSQAGHGARTYNGRPGPTSAGGETPAQAGRAGGAHQRPGIGDPAPATQRARGIQEPGARNQEPLAEPRGHRAIGVVYQPGFEQWGNYVPTVLPQRYDGFLYVEESRAVHPLHIKPRADAEPPETYPWNV